MLDVPRAHGLMLDQHGGGLGNVIGHAGESFSRAQAIYTSSNESVARSAGRATSANMTPGMSLWKTSVGSLTSGGAIASNGGRPNPS